MGLAGSVDGSVYRGLTDVLQRHPVVTTVTYEPDSISKQFIRATQHESSRPAVQNHRGLTSSGGSATTSRCVESTTPIQIQVSTVAGTGTTAIQNSAQYIFSTNSRRWTDLSTNLRVSKRQFRRNSAGLLWIGCSKHAFRHCVLT